MTQPFYQLDAENRKITEQVDEPCILTWKKNLASIMLDPGQISAFSEAADFLDGVDGFLWTGGLENDLHSMLFECRLVVLDLLELARRS